MDNTVNHLYAFTIIFECIKGIHSFCVEWNAK